MCEAIVRGILSRDASHTIMISEAYESRCKALQEIFPGVHVTNSNVEVVNKCEVVVIAVKPQQLATAFSGMNHTANPLFISICAGVTVSRLEEVIVKTARIARVMPNLPAMVGEGASGFCLNGNCQASDSDLVKYILGAVGSVVESVPESLMDAVTGVSGSGKTTLVKNIFYPALQKVIGSYTGSKTGKHEKIAGDLHLVKQVEMVDQNPIGKSSRSNPITYLKAYDSIRDLYSELPASKVKKLKPSHFSFNVDGGRCEHCKGEGEVTIEMQFMADLILPCEFCKGKRFKEEILEITYKDKSIADILDLTVDEAMEFFADNATIANKIEPLQKVGLGYVALGQSSNTLSGGEAQRIKLATFLGKGNSKETHTVFIFDEPTTGLHFQDIKKLLYCFNALIEKGHTVIIIEHNMDVIKCADWVIDLGAEGGDKGGHLVFEGTPEGLAKCKESYTGQFLIEKLSQGAAKASR